MTHRVFEHVIVFNEAGLLYRSHNARSECADSGQIDYLAATRQLVVIPHLRYLLTFDMNRRIVLIESR